MEEEIKWANAAELGHMTQQIPLSKKDRAVISDFLKLPDNKNYDQKLEQLKKYLSEIPNSKLFSDNLNPINLIATPEWERWFPIEKTPATHLLHASYLRIKPLLMKEDTQIGLPMPYIFYRKENILGIKESYTIGKLDTFYYIIRPFCYKFQDILELDSMRFALFDISNPQYVMLSRPDSKYKGAPTPIYKNGKIYPMMTDKEYMMAYQKYIRRNKTLSTLL
jgi:hypothetical protein